jgi:glycosyltransferase involved in cell wall biosynthesis
MLDVGLIYGLENNSTGTMPRVYLFRGKHPLYEALVNHPPEGVEYLPKVSSHGLEEYSLYTSSYGLLRRVSDDFFSAIGTPRWIPILNHYDLVHSSRGFFVIGPNRYALDMEHVATFVGMRHRRLESGGMRRLIEKGLLSPKCRRILPHCEAAQRSLSIVTKDPAVADKTTVIYPTVDMDLVPPSHSSDAKPCILFVGEYLWKGGREVLEACRRLAPKYDFRVAYVSIRVHPPDKDIWRTRKSVQVDYFRGPIPRQDLFQKVYPFADIFVMPTYLDTFGYAYLEAMAFGLPCVGTNHFAVPEIIENERTGILVEPPLSYFDSTGKGHPELSVESLRTDKTIDELCVALGRLVESGSLRRRMGREGRQSVSEGKFSIGRRNAILREAYESCLRK